MSAKIGCAAQSLHRWVVQAERDFGQRAGLTSAERDRLKDLERGNRELKRSNERLQREFETVVDVYIETCAALGQGTVASVQGPLRRPRAACGASRRGAACDPRRGGLERGGGERVSPYRREGRRRRRIHITTQKL